MGSTLRFVTLLYKGETNKKTKKKMYLALYEYKWQPFY